MRLYQAILDHKTNKDDFDTLFVLAKDIPGAVDVLRADADLENYSVKELKLIGDEEQNLLLGETQHAPL